MIITTDRHGDAWRTHLERCPQCKGADLERTATLGRCCSHGAELAKQAAKEKAQRQKYDAGQPDWRR